MTASAEVADLHVITLTDCSWPIVAYQEPRRCRVSFMVGMSCSGVRRAKAAFLSGCESNPAILLQPEAIGAVMEVTKWLKPSV